MLFINTLQLGFLDRRLVRWSFIVHRGEQLIRRCFQVSRIDPLVFSSSSSFSSVVPYSASRYWRMEAIEDREYLWVLQHQLRATDYTEAHDGSIRPQAIRSEPTLCAHVSVNPVRLTEELNTRSARVWTRASVCTRHRQRLRISWCAARSFNSIPRVHTIGS